MVGIILFTLNCGCLGKVKKIVTAILKDPGGVAQGADEYIPDHASEYADPYKAPWPDPGFTSPPDYDSGHSGSTGGAYNSFSSQNDIPQGITPLDITGKGVNKQLSPSDETDIATLKDSYDDFNE